MCVAMPTVHRARSTIRACFAILRDGRDAHERRIDFVFMDFFYRKIMKRRRKLTAISTS